MNDLYKKKCFIVVDVLINKLLDNLSKNTQTIEPLFDIFKTTKSDKDKNVFGADFIKKVIYMFPPTRETDHIIDQESVGVKLYI